MIAEILSTGNEVLCGAVVDSNAAFIAQHLEEAGIEVRRHVCVGDDMDDLVAALTEIAGRADVALMTGGLGPTGDDLTGEAVAKAAGVPLVFNEEAHQSVAAFFESRRGRIQDSDNKQAMLPQGASCIVNDVGSAPGFVTIIGNCRVFAMPGVPHEMKKMVKDFVLPYIGQLETGARLHAATRTVSVFGLPESIVGQRIKPFNEVFPGLRYGIRVKFPEIYVKVTARLKDAAEAEKRVGQAAQWVSDAIGNPAFSMTGDSLEVETARLLKKVNATIAVAESCTGGLLADLLTSVPGSSAYFLLSAVTYANQAKIDLLDVPAATIEANGAVSEETAKAMAEGARRIAGATYGIATSGIAGPDGGTEEKPVGTVCIGIATPEKTDAMRWQLSFQNRAMNKRIFAFVAIEALRQELLKAME
ncbi:MAG: competence/damage-inducible protein A [Thermodesulfobacteriota bacterium]|nr:competence/damage-inducible protein A [Thermodesulfobacteriota bacterium]